MVGSLTDCMGGWLVQKGSWQAVCMLGCVVRQVGGYDLFLGCLCVAVSLCYKLMLQVCFCLFVCLFVCVFVYCLLFIDY